MTSDYMSVTFPFHANYAYTFEQLVNAYYHDDMVAEALYIPLLSPISKNSNNSNVSWIFVTLTAIVIWQYY